MSRIAKRGVFPVSRVQSRMRVKFPQRSVWQPLRLASNFTPFFRFMRVIERRRQLCGRFAPEPTDREIGAYGIKICPRRQALIVNNVSALMGCNQAALMRTYGRLLSRDAEVAHCDETGIGANTIKRGICAQTARLRRPNRAASTISNEILHAMSDATVDSQRNASRLIFIWR